MRIYSNFPEAINEIRRELKEMGITIHTKSVQNKDISTDDEMSTYEIQNYSYTVTNPQYSEIPLKVPEWAEAEFQERISGKHLNPGEAWKLRSAYWKQFLTPDDKFDYAYPQRMALPLSDVIRALNKDLYTRRAFLPIFDRQLDDPKNFGERIPCSLGYWFNFRQGKLNVTYLLRSSDFGEHFNNDIYLADRLKCYVAAQVGVQPGHFSHWIGSLHIFKKDVKDVF